GARTGTATLGPNGLPKDGRERFFYFHPGSRNLKLAPADDFVRLNRSSRRSPDVGTEWQTLVETAVDYNTATGHGEYDPRHQPDPDIHRRNLAAALQFKLP